MHSHTTASLEIDSAGSAVALIGHPNVGKSVIFQRLTGQHAVVSNYPGTTVEVTRGATRAPAEFELIDTPGVIAFPPHSEDEQVTERVLLDEPLKAVLQVGDGKNLRRTLLLTVQLAEMGLPLVLALNMMDEAGARGIRVNQALLAEHLALPVVPTIATRGQGIEELSARLASAGAPSFRLQYAPEIEAALAAICLRLPAAPIASRAMALLWLSADPVAEEWLRARMDGSAYQELVARRAALQLSFHDPLPAVIQQTRLDFAGQVADAVVVENGAGRRSFSTWLGRQTTHPVWGLVVLAIVLYGLYWFVGVFGAGTLVGALEEKLFGGWLNPIITAWVQRIAPAPWIAEALVGDYGLWSMGMTYALALILPIVTTFFLAFGVMEDSGYLPRLAALSNRAFQTLGLNGKAVLPMVLGLGCVTMATLTTRVLESKRERLLVILLLALAVPCSAQLGVVMGMLAGISLTATLIWGGVVTLVLLAVGWLAAKLVPGERTQLLIELPPLRLPLFSNVVIKTLARLEWYLKEVVPLFLLGTFLMFLFDQIGLLERLIHLGEPLVAGWLGLPVEASAAFLMGFMRRDFGATGLFVMEAQGLLTPLQVVVAMVTVTLFVPCVASVFMIAKERSWRTALSISAVIFPLAFLVGGLLQRGLTWIGWGF